VSADAAVTRHGSELPSLVIISGSHRGRRIPVLATGTVLGREGKLASLFGDDPLVSRGHAHIYLAEDRSVQVADLNSTNGTFVNGEG
jgi:FHA domain